jgi:hypothetical protein
MQQDPSARRHAVLCLLVVFSAAACGPSAVQTSLVVGGSFRRLRGEQASGAVDRTAVVMHASLRIDERVLVGQLAAAPLPRSPVVADAAFPCASSAVCAWERRAVGRALTRAWANGSRDVQGEER